MCILGSVIEYDTTTIVVVARDRGYYYLVGS